MNPLFSPTGSITRLSVEIVMNKKSFLKIPPERMNSVGTTKIHSLVTCRSDFAHRSRIFRSSVAHHKAADLKLATAKTKK